MWQRFNESARSAILRAQQKAEQRPDAHTVETEHLLLALMEEESGIVSQLFASYHITTDLAGDDVKATVSLSPLEIKEIGEEFRVDDQLIRQIEARLLQKLRGQRAEMKLSENVKRVLELAADEAREIHNIVQGSTEIGSQHLLLGLLRLPDTPTCEMLHERGLSLETARVTVVESMKN